MAGQDGGRRPAQLEYGNYLKKVKVKCRAEQTKRLHLNGAKNVGKGMEASKLLAKS